MPVSSRARSRPRTYAPRKTPKTASELEQIIADAFGCPVVQVGVRGNPPDWSAVLITGRASTAERQAEFRRLVMDVQRAFALRPGR